MVKKRIDEIKAMYIKKYPHLAVIKNNRQFFFNATCLCIPEGVTALEFYQIVTEYDF